MKLNKIIIPTLIPVIAATGFSITSCNKENWTHTPMFNKTKAVDDTVYVITLPTTNKDEWYVTLQSLQGILAQTKARIYIKESENRYAWFKPMQEKMGFKTVEVNTLEQICELLKTYKWAFDSKYVLYTKCTAEADKNLSIDKATTIAAGDNLLMVERSLKTQIDALGFSQASDADSKTTAQLFEQYKDKLNNSMLFNQKPWNKNLRDYCISSRCFCTYMEYLKENTTEGGATTCKNLLAWSKPNCPILGWNENEVKFVEAISQYSKVITPSDHCSNLSFYSAYTPEGKYKQKHKEKITPQKGKHYVAIVMTDGDNIQWLQSDFTNSDWFGSKYRGLFPLTWTLSPGPYDVNAGVLDKLYASQSINDNFICGPSGYGYINYDTYGKPDEFATLTNNYMEATDMTIGNFIDFYQDKKNPDAFNHPMNQKQIKGGTWCFGDWYIGGQGGVYWRNDKPIVCMREGLWELKDEHEVVRPESQQFLSPKQVAARINNYSTDPTSISGYTLVTAHVWSYGKMDTVKQFVDLLDKNHVVLVTAEQLIDMVSENVPHVDVAHADKYPVKPF